jgi:hypothetical protein
VTYARAAAADRTTPCEPCLGRDPGENRQRRTDEEEVKHNGQDGMDHVAHPF